jgi:hypothetical protein
VKDSLKSRIAKDKYQELYEDMKKTKIYKLSDLLQNL